MLGRSNWDIKKSRQIRPLGAFFKNLPGGWTLVQKLTLVPTQCKYELIQLLKSGYGWVKEGMGELLHWWIIAWVNYRMGEFCLGESIFGEKSFGWILLGWILVWWVYLCWMLSCWILFGWIQGEPFKTISLHTKPPFDKILAIVRLVRKLLTCWCSV